MTSLNRLAVSLALCAASACSGADSRRPPAPAPAAGAEVDRHVLPIADPAYPASTELDASKATADQIRVLMKAHLRDGDVHISEEQVKFSERAKRVVEAAKQEAFRGQNQVSPEHLLLGLTRVTNTVCSAVLRAVNITDESIRATLGITPK